MKTTVFEDVHAMYYKFKFPIPKQPEMLSKEDFDGRMNFLYEELTETMTAHLEDDIEEVIDGLIDLMVVAAGTLSLMGIEGQRHWDEVHRANMSKQIGKKPGRDMKHDLIKPNDWIPPNHSRILEAKDYEASNIHRRS